jgi:hypothetical protein
LRWPEEIAKDILVKIQDYYVPTDFLVLDMPGDEDTPIIWGKPFLNTSDVVIYIRSRQIHFRLPKVYCQGGGANPVTVHSRMDGLDFLELRDPMTWSYEIQ